MSFEWLLETSVSDSEMFRSTRVVEAVDSWVVLGGMGMGRMASSFEPMGG